MCDLVLGDSEGDFFVEAGAGAYDSYVGVGVEAVEDAASSDLELC